MHRDQMNFIASDPNATHIVLKYILLYHVSKIFYKIKHHVSIHLATDNLN